MGEQLPLYSTCLQVTSSQAQRASAGDVSTRLALIPLSECEATLAQWHIGPQTESSVLDLLQRPQPSGITKADALRLILESLGDDIEGASTKAAMLWRYAEQHKIWETSSQPSLRTPAAFVKSLEHHGLIYAGVVLGTSTDAARRASNRVIEDAWGADWFSRLSAQVTLSFTSPAIAPKRILAEIAATCRVGLSLEDASQQWQRARRERITQASQTTGCHPTALRDWVTGTDITLVRESHRPKAASERTMQAYLPEIHEDPIVLQGFKTGRNLPASKKRPRAGQRTSNSKRPRVKAGGNLDTAADLIDSEARILNTQIEANDGEEAEDNPLHSGTPTSSPGDDNVTCEGAELRHQCRRLTSRQDTRDYCTACRQWWLDILRDLPPELRQRIVASRRIPCS